MKKSFIVLLCMAAGLLSCTNDDHNVEKQTPINFPMTFNINVEDGTTTRASKTAWANGDKIYVFFKGLETKYLVMTYDGTTWSNASGGDTLLSSDFSSLGTKTLTAVHFPVAVDVTYEDSKFTFTNGGKPVYNYYLCEVGKSYSVDGTTVTASLSMGKPVDMVQIHVAGIQANVADYTFGCSKIKPVACKSVGIDGTIIEDVLQAGARLNGVADADGGIFAGRLVYPGVAKDYSFTVANNANIYTLTRSSRTLEAGKMYNFPSLPASSDANWTVTAASDLYVDLGLSVKWAKYNLGATTETDYGDYFAWGETTGYNEGKANFAWSTYAFGSEYNQIMKYCNSSSYGKDGFTDALTVLLPEDDAAYAALGGKFRMPTSEELDELKNSSNCDWSWQDNYNSTGIKGYFVTSKKSGYTDKSIFLPAAGFLKSSFDRVGENGNYWSSSLYTTESYYAYYVWFKSGETQIYGNTRYVGHPVRPVYKE